MKTIRGIIFPAPGQVTLVERDLEAPAPGQLLVLRYLADGRLQVDPLISHRFAPEQAAEAYRILNEQRDRTMGVLFTWS